MPNLQLKTPTYRRLTPDDMDQWFQFRIEALGESPSAFETSPERVIEQGVEVFRQRVAEGGDENVIFAAFNGDQLIGSIGIIKDDGPKTYFKAFIWGMYVVPEVRGLGVGKTLVQTAIEHAQQKMQVEQITLSVDTSRAPAKALYESFGFKVWGKETKAMRIDGVYYDEEYMKLELTT